MNILITGTSGFIGGHLLKAACTAYGSEQVTAFSSRATAECYSIVYGGSPDFALSAADLEQLASVEVLIHAGAFTPKGGADANQITGCNSNIEFTQRLLDLPFSRLQKIVYLSTLDVYQAAELTTEDTPTVPATLYGLSKLYCERLASLSAAARGVPFQILRIGHVYGPGEERYAKFIPTAIRSILDKGSVELWGDGSDIRSFIYIDDVVQAILNAVSLQEDVGVINVVGGVRMSIRELIDELMAASGRPVRIEARESAAAKRNYIFDNAKLRRYLLPVECDFREGLRAEFDHMVGRP